MGFCITIHPSQQQHARGSEMEAAINEAQGIMNNKEVMTFLRQQALEKVSAELNAKGLCTTPKGVDVLSMSKQNKAIEERIQQYIAAGIVGCLMAKYQ